MITLSSNPMFYFGKLHGITAKEMSISTGLARTTCDAILKNPLKKVTPETDAAVDRWAKTRIPEMGRPFAIENVTDTTDGGRPGLLKNVSTNRRRHVDEICPTCHMAMPLTGICCDEEVHITS